MKKLVVIAMLIIIAACDRGRNNPGWDYFPDMFYSTAYESYTENPNFRDGMTMRVPPGGSVAREEIPFEYTIESESRAKAGIELINPFEPTGANIERGRVAYGIFCVNCHGPSGQGDGRLFELGVYPLKPRPVAGATAAPLKDGEIYHTITLGFGSMGPHGSQVRPADRWKIVLYLRQLQKEQQ